MAKKTSESRTPDAPAFWFGFETSWAKVALARTVIFGLLALDALLQIRHAPRYGVGGFNVAQLPGFDALGPGRASYGTAQLVEAYLLVLAACGVATRYALPIATAIYAWLYFGSQLDSYQHHYLMALFLLLACFVPWQRPPGATAETPVRSWALRLVLVQLAILYFWAAVSKMNGAWLGGHTLGGQIEGPMRTLIDRTVGIATASRMVMVTELALAATIWIRPLWPVAAVLGIGLHLGIVLSDLEIGLFAWLMLAMYVLVIPDRVWIALARNGAMRAASRAWAAAKRTVDGTAPPFGGADGRKRVPAVERAGGWPVWIAAVVGGLVAGAELRIPGGLGVAVVATVALFGVAAGVALGGKGRALAAFAAAHLAAFGLWTAVDRGTTVVSDYYKYWGASERRFGDRATAEQIYRHAVEVEPDDETAHFQLGRVLLARDATDEGLAQLHAAEEIEPMRARAFVTEARWLVQHGPASDALYAACRGFIAQPDDADARATLDAIAHGRAPDARAARATESEP